MLFAPFFFFFCWNSWLSTVLCREPNTNLRKNRIRTPSLSIPFQRQFEGPAEEFVAGGLDEASGQPEEWRGRCQAAQVVPECRLDGHLRASCQSSVHAQRGVWTVRRGATLHIIYWEICKRVCRVLRGPCVNARRCTDSGNKVGRDNTNKRKVFVNRLSWTQSQGRQRTFFF